MHLDTVWIDFYRYALPQLGWQILQHVLLQPPDEYVLL